jgi:cobalt-zinc-cadmium resistance protein CzcA
VLTEEWKKSEVNVSLKTSELKMRVSQVFYNLVNLEEKRDLLMEIDSIYSSYLEKANLRIKVGESNILEKTTIENQLIQIRNQLNQLNTNFEIESLHFQFLLNSPISYAVSTSDIKMKMNRQIDKSLVEKHPILQLLDANVQIALSTIKLQQAKLHPNLLVAVNSGTMFGTGSNNLNYDHSTRFNSAQIGFGIPFFTGQKQNVKAAKINAEIASNNFDIESQSLNNQFNIAVKQYEVQSLIVKDLENLALPNGIVIFETAQKQFLNGDINYLEWAILVNQSISIKSDYQDAILRLNDSTIKLIYLLNGF